MNRYASVFALLSLGGACASRTIDGGRGSNGATSGDDPVGDAGGVEPKFVEPGGDERDADAGGDGNGGDADGGGDSPNPSDPPILLNPIYRLAKERSLASPIAPSTGIAHDGTGLWVISGAAARTHRLVRFDPDTLTIDRDFTFSNLVEAAGVGVGGITWDGTSIWIAVSGNINKLVVVNPMTGQITRTMSSPTQLGPVDLDFGAGRLWVSTGRGELRRLVPATGGIDFEFMHVAPAKRDYGVAIRANGQVWVGGLSYGEMYVYDSSGNLEGSAVHADGSPFKYADIGQSAFVGSQFVVLSELGITYYSVSNF